MSDPQLPFEQMHLSVLVKRISQTSPKYGMGPMERPAKMLIQYGVVNINKPRGPTSHEVSAYVQRILGLKKAGHAGTLDPKVTGVLPIALGRATKVVQHLLTAGKEYVTIIHFHRVVDEQTLKTLIEDFTGKIQQLPPVKSAVKRQVRTRSIYYIELLGVNGQDVLLKVGCQAGTYIRKLAHDMGARLGCGAHMAELVRTKAAGFDDTELWSMQDLVDAYYYFWHDKNDKALRKVIQPVERAVSHLKKIWVIDSAVESLCHGAHLKIPGVAKLNDKIGPDDAVALMTLKDELIAIAIAKMSSKDIMKEDRGVVAKTDQVFMEPLTYPKMD